MEDAAGQKFDVAIAGAGPAGSAAAIRLAAGGLKVLLVERARFPREKLCGEFVSPECVRHFEELGVVAPMSANRPRIESTIFYSQQGRSVEFRSDWFDSGHQAMGISRADMDHILIDRARAAGAEVWSETSVIDVDVESDRALVRLRRRADSFEIECQVVIDATGRKRTLGESSTMHVRAPKVAFKTHLGNARMSRSHCEIYSYRGGYGGCNAIGENRFNLCFIIDARLVKQIGSDAEQVMRTILFRNAAARRALAEADFDSPWLAVPVGGYGRKPPVERGRILFVGDSAAFIDPFTGSGILLALQSAEVCAGAILGGFERGIPADRIAQMYASAYNQMLANRLRVSSLLRPASSSPQLAELVLALASRSERLRSALARATRLSGVPGA